MSYINLQIPQEQITRLDHLAKRLKINRSAYIRKAIQYYMAKTERQLLAAQFEEASKKCRDESLLVCNEFENIDRVPE